VLAAQQNALPLAASDRFGFASGTATSPLKTRVGSYCRKRLDRRRGLRRLGRGTAPSCKSYGYKTASGPTYDGNGNIIALVNAADGSLAASFEYDPFGNTIKATGVAANVQPFGFSTKYTDTETGLCYYGYRYYSPATGRWPSRDPMEEKGGVHLYSMVANDTISRVDPLGLFLYSHIFILKGGETDVYPINTEKSLGITEAPEGPKIQCNDGDGSIRITLECIYYYLSPRAIREHADRIWSDPTGLMPEAVSSLAKTHELQHVGDLKDWLENEVPRVLAANGGSCCSDITKKLKKSYKQWYEAHGSYWDGPDGNDWAPKRHAINPDGTLSYPLLK
jgi:RHS repeat-associated protein